MLLGPTAENEDRARMELCRLLIACTEINTADTLVDWIIRLSPTAENENQARSALIRLISLHGPSRLASILTQLHPTVADLKAWHTWPEPAKLPTTLLAAARRNSSLTAWVDALSTYASWPS